MFTQQSVDALNRMLRNAKYNEQVYGKEAQIDIQPV